MVGKRVQVSVGGDGTSVGPVGVGPKAWCAVRVRVRTHRVGAVLEDPGGAELVEVEGREGRVAAGREEGEGEVQPFWTIFGVCDMGMMSKGAAFPNRTAVESSTRTHRCCSRLVPAAMSV